MSKRDPLFFFYISSKKTNPVKIKSGETEVRIIFKSGIKKRTGNYLAGMLLDDDDMDLNTTLFI